MKVEDLKIGQWCWFVRCRDGIHTAYQSRLDAIVTDGDGTDARFIRDKHSPPPFRHHYVPIDEVFDNKNAATEWACEKVREFANANLKALKGKAMTL